MYLSKNYERTRLTYTWSIIDVSEENKELIDMMVEMDGIEFINYEEFKLNLELLERGQWLAVYTDLIGVWFGEESRNQIADLLIEYGSTF